MEDLVHLFGGGNAENPGGTWLHCCSDSFRGATENANVDEDQNNVAIISGDMMKKRTFGWTTI